MMYTEKEAKTKWCPQSRVFDCELNLSGQNRPFTWHGEDNKCIASACMAWRAGIYAHQRNLPERDRTPGVGFCGLAGSPKGEP